ncbi:MAG: Rrf2 family transcriptional regulator [Acidobacteriota bacterium]|nr:Rrf2 family transcriptional regulator [Acidobacteriota bacterium]
MNISVKAEYGLLAVFDLARQRPGEPVKIADVARRQKIPQKFLELILAGLKQGGFVESRRGAEGGYLLTRPAESITVGEVLRYMEGDEARKKRDKASPITPLTAVWERVDTALSGVLDHLSFGELARTWDERQAKYVPNWDI